MTLVSCPTLPPPVLCEESVLLSHQGTLSLFPYVTLSHMCPLFSLKLRSPRISQGQEWNKNRSNKLKGEEEVIWTVATPELWNMSKPTSDPGFSLLSWVLVGNCYFLFLVLFVQLKDIVVAFAIQLCTDAYRTCTWCFQCFRTWRRKQWGCSVLPHLPHLMTTKLLLASFCVFLVSVINGNSESPMETPLMY